MSDPTPDTPPAARPARSGPRRLLRMALLGALAVLLILLILLVGLYLARREAAREVLTGWLERRGIEAEIEIERIDFDGFIGRVRAGPESRPDFVADRVEVDYAVGWPWSPDGLGVTPSRIRLVSPVLRARLADGELSFGSLDPLIEEFAARPPRPDVRGPHVIVEDGRLFLATDHGPIQIDADARLNENRLLALDARLPRTALRGEAGVLTAERATLSLRTVGDRIKARLSADVTEASGGDFALADGRLRLSGDMPYPDVQARRGGGDVEIAGGFQAGRLDSGANTARDLDLDLDFDGRTEGWIEAFEITGDLRAAATAGRLTGPGLDARGAVVRTAGARLEVTRGERTLDWRIEGPAVVRAASGSAGGLDFGGLTLRSGRLLAGGRRGEAEASGALALSADRFGLGDLALTGVDGRFEADLRAAGPMLLTLDGALSASGGRWPVFGPAGADDAPELAGLKAALANFGARAPGVRVTAGTPGAEIRLTRPAVISPANGGAISLTARENRPLFAAAAGAEGVGALDIAASGGALPELDLAVPRWRLTRGGFDADLEGTAALDFDFIRNGRVQADGLLAMDRGTLTFAAAGCQPVSAGRFELGENDILDVSGGLCPAGGPLLTVRDGGWRLDGGMRDAAATAPFLQMAFEDINGALSVQGRPAGVGLQVGVTGARVRDIAELRRFHPLGAVGQASLADGRWLGGFDLLAGGGAVGRVDLAHDGGLETGGVTIAAPNLIFAEGGLQPQDLTPLADRLAQGPVSGRAAFTGRFDWSPEGATSSGLFTADRLNFPSPAGAAEGLSGEVLFTSLAPLISAPDQRMTIERLNALTPLTDLEVVFQLGPDALVLSTAGLDAAGGAIRIEPFELPLDPDAPYSGVIVLENVQLGDLIPATGFGDQIGLDAVVSGRLPFESDGERLRIVGGYLTAAGPGRLSIQRTALSGLQAGGGGEELPPNTVQDFAYQAMENLAFEVLEAEVNSLPEGRLGVLFRIRGRHDPPRHQEIRLTVQELMSRSFLNRVLPLPSGTGIDLTLDTTLNLDQLLADVAALNRARRGLPELETEPDAGD